MQKFDPQMATRVWNRVQSCRDKEAKPPETIRVVHTPPEAWKETCPQKEPVCCRRQPQMQLPWLWLVLLWVLCC